jgi:hypothetical protein
MSGLFSVIAPRYREAGFWPRPIRPGTKACKLSGWQRPDPDIPHEDRECWLKTHGDMGIGLLMGSPLPDGTRLGALDIDHDNYVALGEILLRGPPCARRGSKGIVFFVRVRGDLGNPEFRIKGEAGETSGKVAECLFFRKLCVIPPTVHPATERPYAWCGRSLFDTHFSELPIIGA